MPVRQAEPGVRLSSSSGQQHDTRGRGRGRPPLVHSRWIGNPLERERDGRSVFFQCDKSRCRMVRLGSRMRCIVGMRGKDTTSQLPQQYMGETSHQRSGGRGSVRCRHFFYKRSIQNLPRFHCFDHSRWRSLSNCFSYSDCVAGATRKHRAVSFFVMTTYLYKPNNFMSLSEFAHATILPNMLSV
jgi:hypothetical protein